MALRGSVFSLLDCVDPIKKVKLGPESSHRNHKLLAVSLDHLYHYVALCTITLHTEQKNCYNYNYARALVTDCQNFLFKIIAIFQFSTCKKRNRA